MLRLDVEPTSVLVTGDVEPTAQRNPLRQRLDLRADVLNVRHHGSGHQEQEQRYDGRLIRMPKRHAAPASQARPLTAAQAAAVAVRTPGADSGSWDDGACPPTFSYR